MLKTIHLKVTATDDISVAHLVKEIAKNMSGPALNILRHLNFASQREVTMLEGRLTGINPLSYRSRIPVHRHKSSLPKSSCYHQ